MFNYIQFSYQEVTHTLDANAGLLKYQSRQSREWNNLKQSTPCKGKHKLYRTEPKAGNQNKRLSLAIDKTQEQDFTLNRRTSMLFKGISVIGNKCVWLIIWRQQTGYKSCDLWCHLMRSLAVHMFICSLAGQGNGVCAFQWGWQWHDNYY